MAVRHAVVNATEQSSCCYWVALHLASSLKHYGSASQFFRRLTKQLLLLLKQGFALAKKTTLPSGLCWLPFHDDWGGIFKSLEKQKHMDIKGGRGKLKFAMRPGHYPRSLLLGHTIRRNSYIKLKILWFLNGRDKRIYLVPLLLWLTEETIQFFCRQKCIYPVSLSGKSWASSSRSSPIEHDPPITGLCQNLRAADRWWYLNMKLQH